MNHFRRILWLAAQAILDKHPLGSISDSDTLTLLEFKSLFEKIRDGRCPHSSDAEKWLKVYAEAERRGEV